MSELKALLGQLIAAQELIRRPIGNPEKSLMQKCLGSRERGSQLGQTSLERATISVEQAPEATDAGSIALGYSFEDCLHIAASFLSLSVIDLLPPRLSMLKIFSNSAA
jgi:hypothetical protein